MRPATSAEIRDWDELVLANPDGGHILQTRSWGEFKRRWGWQPHYFIADSGRGHVATLFLTRRVPGAGTLWYSPKGPGIAKPDELCDILRDPDGFDRGFLVKLDPEIDAAADTSPWRSAGMQKAPTEVQNSTATILVDLRGEEDGIIASFKPKCRYNIRLAARRGVVVHRLPVTDATIDVMYRLMRETQVRAGFMLRPPRYFADYWRLQHAAGQGEFYFATLGHEVLAGCFATHFGHKGWYKDGGSSRRHHELMAPYLLQWEVMRSLRERGVQTYDLVAVPPAAELDPAHPFYGLYRFKSGFNDRITEFVGTWDWPLRRRRYRWWTQVGERLARQWTYRVHHDFFY